MRHFLLSGALTASLLMAGRAEAQFFVDDRVPGEDFHVELGAMFWPPSPTLRIQTGALAQIGESEVDLVQEFGIENKRFTEWRAVLKPGRKHKIRFSYVPMEYNSEAVLQRTFMFGGSTFPVAVPATAHLKWELYRFGYEYDFVAADRGLLGLVAEVKYNKVTAELAAAGYGSELTEAQAPVPTLGVVARVYPHRNFSVTSEFGGFKMPGFIADRISDSISGDFEAKLFDFDISGTVSVNRHIGVQGGYRRVAADYLVDLDAGDLKMQGMYFGGLVRF
jgi:hypothetical protein